MKTEAMRECVFDWIRLTEGDFSVREMGKIICGRSFRSFLDEAERCSGVVVFWGCWDDEELDFVF